ncbi:unnamed protein product [Rhizophagus irregularis]|nr:unnamed protein product [Rhizophagus irregularis]
MKSEFGKGHDTYTLKLLNCLLVIFSSGLRDLSITSTSTAAFVTSAAVSSHTSSPVVISSTSTAVSSYTSSTVIIFSTSAAFTTSTSSAVVWTGSASRF